MRDYRAWVAFSLMIGALVAGASAAPSQDSPGAGTLQGRVLFDGEKAPPPGIVRTDAVVYLVGNAAAPPDAGAPAAVEVLDQQSLTFVPRVLPIAVGSKVEFRNGDAVLHNIHTYVFKAGRRDRTVFNRAQLPKRSFQYAFTSPDIIQVGCDVHSQMNAYILVLPTRVFTKASADGTYSLTGVPPGTYQVVAWHEKYGTVSANVEVRGGGTAQADLNLVKTSATAKGSP